MSEKFVTSRGFEIEFLPIPRAIQKFNLKHQQPEPPNYEVKTATGIVEHHPHNETTLETDADKEQWAEYQRQLALYNEKFLRVCFIKGILVRASMDEWIAEQTKLEIPIAEDATERKIEWILDYVIVTEEDFRQVVLGVMKASGAPEELLTQIESLFRGKVGESERQDTQSIDAGDGNGQNQEDLVLQSEIRGSTDSLRDGNTPEPIRQMETERQTVRARRAAHKKQNGDVGTDHSE